MTEPRQETPSATRCPVCGAPLPAGGDARARTIRYLFNAVAELDTPARRTYLAKLRQQEPELGREVRSLLEAAERLGPFLETTLPLPANRKELVASLPTGGASKSGGSGAEYASKLEQRPSGKKEQQARIASILDRLART